MTLSSQLRFDIEDAPSDADVEILPNGLEEFNERRWPGHQPWKALAVFARDGQRIVAGLSGGTYCGWLHPLSVGQRGAAQRGDRTPAHGRRRGPGAGARLPLGLGRHFQLPGPRLLPQARL
jgi:hypothetical protein